MPLSSLKVFDRTRLAGGRQFAKLDLGVTYIASQNIDTIGSLTALPFQAVTCRVLNPCENAKSLIR